MGSLLTLESQPRAAFFDTVDILPFIPPGFQPFRNLLGLDPLRREVAVNKQTELPNITLEIDNSGDQFTSWFRKNPPFKVRGELSELRNGQLKSHFIGSVLGIELGDTIKLTLES